MDRITDFMARRPRWSALLLGLVSATGFQPLHIWPLALAAMGALVWLVHRQESARTAFFVGWQLREEVLGEAARNHRQAIGDGMRWLEQAGKSFPLIAAALERGAE